MLNSCSLERGAKIGAGSIVLDGAVVGAFAEVLPGSVVTAGTAIPSGEVRRLLPCVLHGVQLILEPVVALANSCAAL